MHKSVALLAIIILIFSGSVNAETVEGGVTKTGAVSGNRVLDHATNQPVANAAITLPKLQYQTYTDENGAFHLGTAINGPTVMSVEKEGYRPYSLTINQNSASKPLVVSIQKSNANDISLETEMMHLGDNTYSKSSANSGDFRISAAGPFYSKTFTMAATALNKTNYLVIGSIIGIDTAMARAMGQNNVKNSFSSPPEVFFNGNKIAEIHLNGDGQRVKIPSNLIKPNSKNEITIKTGRNLMQTAYTDYDDIEIMNLSIWSD